jgi:hypothetical protein
MSGDDDRIVHTDMWGEDSRPEDDIEAADAVVLPDVGDDKTPSSDMILRGAHGNGKRQSLTPELARQLQLERKKMHEENRLSRREAYEEGMRDALARIAGFETSILDIGIALLDRLDRGEALSRKEIDTLKLAQKSAIEMKDRAMGKAKTMSEVKTQNSILHLIAGIVPDA